MKDENKTVEICQHTISYYYDNDQEMPEHEQQHVQEMIVDGYCQGILNDLDEHGYEIGGWWQILRDV